MKTSLSAHLVLAFGLVCWLAVLALAISYVASAPGDPSRAGAWIVIVLFGGVGLCILPAALGYFRRGGELAAIDDERGVTNLKDRLGPIAWRDIHGASIKTLAGTRGASTRRALFVHVPDAIAREHLARARWFARLALRPRSHDGFTELAIMGYPPYSDAALQAALEKIQSLARGGPNSQPIALEGRGHGA